MRLGLKIHVVCALEGEIYWQIDNIQRNSKVFAPQSIKKTVRYGAQFVIQRMPSVSFAPQTYVLVCVKAKKPIVILYPYVTTCVRILFLARPCDTSFSVRYDM